MSYEIAYAQYVDLYVIIGSNLKSHTPQSLKWSCSETSQFISIGRCREIVREGD